MQEDGLLFRVKEMIFLKMRSISASLRSDGNDRTEKDNFMIRREKKTSQLQELCPRAGWNEWIQWTTGEFGL